MSLETIISENTAAIKELIGLLSRNESAQSVTLITANATSASATNTHALTTEKHAKEAEVDGQSKSPAVTYETAAAVVTKVSKLKGRNVAIELLAKFNGAKNLRDVSPESFQSLVNEANAILK